MNSRNTHLSEYTIKGLICDQYPDWKSLTPNQITLSRLAGLTNITYKAEAILDTTPKQIVFREFGNTEGFVDSQQERVIFSTISDLHLGPKQLKCGQTWRMEEFVTDGEHPTNERMAQPDFQFKSMGVLQKFHQMNIPIPNDGTSLILKKTLSENMKNNVMKKINKRELYSEVELQGLQLVESFLNDDQKYNYLQHMIKKEDYEEIKFCHNDLNQLNIFNTSRKDREILFIDFEYCSYNYPSYDIANFLNESTINYQYELDPYYQLVEENFKTGPIQSHFLALSYILNQECTQEEINKITQLINPQTNKNKDELKTFINLVKQILEQRLSINEVDDLIKSVSYLKRRIRRLQIISNLNWVWWSILLAHEKSSLNFEYIDYGMLRFQMFERLLKLEKERKYATE